MIRPVRRQGRCPALVLACAAAMAAPGLAQDSPRTSFVDRTVLAVGNVEVTVLDRDGRPVRGLSREDFVLHVDGMPQAIEYFGAYTDRPGAKPTPPAPGLEPSPAARGAAAELARRPLVLVLLIDAANTSVFNRNHILGRLASFVRRTVRPPDGAIVAVYDNFLRFASPFTSDAEEIAAALETLRASSVSAGRTQTLRLMAERQLRDLAERSSPRSGGVTLDQALMVARTNAQQLRDSARQSVDGFKVLTRILSGVEGRKAVLYVSDGLPRSPGLETFQLLLELFPVATMSQTEFQTFETTPLWQELGRWAVAADVAFHTLDARGLAAGGEKSAEFARTSPGGRGADQRRSSDLEILHLHNYQDPLVAIANLTGGVAVINTNRFDEELDGLADILASFYSLGFTLEPAEANAVHSVHVALVTGKGHTLRYRPALAQRTTEARMADRTFAGLGFGVQENALAVRAVLGEASPTGRKRFTVPVQVVVPLDKLALLPQGDDQVATLAVWTVAAGEGGVPSPMSRQEHTVAIPAGRLASIGTVTVQTAVDVPAGRCRVAVGVLDRLSGEAGFASAERVLGTR